MITHSRRYYATTKTTLCDNHLCCLRKLLLTVIRVSLYSHPFRYCQRAPDVFSTLQNYRIISPSRAQMHTYIHRSHPLANSPAFVAKRIKNTHLPPRQFHVEFHLSSLKSDSSAKWKSIEWRAVSTLSTHVAGALASSPSLIPAISSFRRSRQTICSSSPSVYLPRAHTRSFARSLKGDTHCCFCTRARIHRSRILVY